MERIYTDTEINVNRVKAELEKIGIPSLVQNEFKSGLIAGFGANPFNVDLFVNSVDLERANLLLDDLNKAI